MKVMTRALVDEPDQRYWRRRANRRVRQARWTSRLRRWSATAVALIVVGIALFQALSHAVDTLRRDRRLAVERIEVEGAELGGAGAIRGRLSSFVGRSLVDLNLRDVALAAAADPWVLDASVKLLLPGTLLVRVAERTPAAAAMIDGAAYVVDTTGSVVGPLTERFASLPRLTGLDRLAEAERSFRLERGVSAVLALRGDAGAWLGEMRELDLSLFDRLVARTVGDGPAILLDPEQAARNLSRYLALRSQIAEQLGRAEYVDLRWRDRIAVMPAAETLPEEGG